MEWREHTSVSCVDAFNEAQRWMEEVTKKSFGSNDFRAALENGLLLCDLINQLKPGLINRINRRSTPIAGLDNVSVFLKACEKLGLNESQLFHPGDLQDMSSRVTLRCEESSRRLKNVLITVYWLGRRAQLDHFYNGPHLNFKAFQGLLGLALSKALEVDSSMRAKDCGYGSWYQGKTEVQTCPRPDCRRQDSMESVDSMDSQTLHVGNEGCGSDAEADQGLRMESTQPPAQLNRTNVRMEFTQPSAQLNRTNVPTALLRRKRGQENEMGCPSPLTRSKSSSDIPMMTPVRHASGATPSDVSTGAVGSVRYWTKDPPLMDRSPKDIEVKWQDEFTKWKIRRRSTSLDFYKKSQEREHVITQMSIGAVASLSETGRRTGVLERDQQSSGSSSSNPANPLMYSTYKGPAIGAMPAAETPVFADGIHSASLGSDAAGVTTPSLECPFSSQTQAKAQPGPELPSPISSLTITWSPNGSPATTLADVTTTTTTAAGGTNGPISITNHRLSHQELSWTSGHDFAMSPLDHHQPAVDPLTEGNVSQAEEAQQGNVSQAEEAQPISSRPGRGQQATNLYRYSSRSMGIHGWSSSASLPRGFRRSEGSTRLSAAITARPFGAKPSRVPSLPSRVSSLPSRVPSLPSRVSSLPSRVSSLPSRVSSLPRLCTVNDNKDLLCKRRTNPRTDPSEVHFSDMRVSLTLKPNSGPDFGLQTHWDSTGARVKFVQPGSPADFCQLCVGDEIVDVNGFTVTQMTYDLWNDTMTSALRTGNLNMEIRRYGNKDWAIHGGGRPDQVCQSRKTLDLTAAVPTLIGRALSTDATVTKSAQQNGQAVNWMAACKEENGDSIGRTNGSKGGSESAISDLQVPSLNPSSCSRWSWDLEGDRRRQERWQEEQERLLQEQYRRDQQRLDAEWQRAGGDAEMQRCRDAEWQRAGGDAEMQRCRDAGGEDKRPESSCELTCPVSRPQAVNGVTSHNKDAEQRTEQEEEEERSKFNNPVSSPQKEALGEQNDHQTEGHWAGDSCGFVQLSASDRGKSKSTPTLGGRHKQAKGVTGPGDQKKRKEQPLSKAEKERQQILEEMRKRTQLLNDNSWIRQRSPTACKEPVYVGVPLRRYESLDNIPTSWHPSGSRPQSAAGYCGPTTNCTSRYSLGTEMTQRLASCTVRDEPSARSSLPSSQQGTRLVSGRRICCVCEHVLGRGAAMVIETLGLCFHFTCFQCVECGQHLGGTEAGSQVRIRSGKPYCDLCYIKLKYGSAAPSR